VVCIMTKNTRCPYYFPNTVFQCRLQIGFKPDKDRIKLRCESHDFHKCGVWKANIKPKKKVWNVS